ncbi:MAG: cytochrome c [Deltaproteobacteria bacterium]
MKALPLCLAIVSLLATASARADEATLARGGLLYDNWSKVVSKKPPAKPNPAYPKTGKYFGKDGADYRCKECHGWDYRGKDGAYASGKHATGIAGIRAAAKRPEAKIVKVLKDSTHGYGDLLSDADLAALAAFVSKGQVDMDRVIDRKTKKARGKAARGKPVFETICAKCHGVDGKGEPKMDALGPLARGNPWETLHKILNGQPDSEMPALRALDRQVALDVLTYAQTLPD